MNWNDSNHWTCFRHFPNLWARAYGGRKLTGCETNGRFRMEDGIHLYKLYLTVQLEPISPNPFFWTSHGLCCSKIHQIFPLKWTKLSQEFWQCPNFETHIPTTCQKIMNRVFIRALVFVFGLRMAHTEDAFCRSTYTTFSRAGLWQTRINLTP